MLDFEKWDKEETFHVMQELLYSFNFMWFLVEGWARANCPEKSEGESFRVLSEQFGSYQAKRLAKTIPDPREGIDRLVAFLKRSHWFVFEDIRLEKISDKSLRMRTAGCTAQKAVKKWGMDHYACGAGGFRLRKGFFTRIDPTANITRVFTPPDEKPADTPEDISCEWVITIR